MNKRTTKLTQLKIIDLYNLNTPISDICKSYNISRGTVSRIVKKSGCNMRHKKVNNIIIGFLTDTTQKENCYLLGLLWADGYVFNKQYSDNSTCYGHRVSLTLTKDDFDIIEPYIRKCGINTIYERQEIRNGRNFGKIQKTFSIHNKLIVEFLLSNDYKLKSFVSPSKILGIIPDNLKHYFWRGYFDGDGYIRANLKIREMSICSTIDQDWNETINLFKNIGVKNYKIKKYIRRNGKCKCSIIKIGSVNDIKNFGNYLYRDYDGIGLYRKYKRYCDFLEIIPSLNQFLIK